MSFAETVAFRYHTWRRAISNFSIIAHRHHDGHIVSMHQSGTHWLKFMLANAIAYHYAVPRPHYNHANDIIGGPRDAIVYPQIPRIISSHTIPHAALGLPAVHRVLGLPPYVVLVRDLRASLVSNFDKWQQRYAEPFATFLDGDPAGRRYNSDLWWCIRFMNAWGRIAARAPGAVTVIRYEALVADPRHGLETVARGLRLPLAAAALDAGVAAGGRDAMAARHDPARPPGEVRAATHNAFTRYLPAARRRLEDRCRRYLRYDFGYDFSDWPPPATSA